MQQDVFKRKAKKKKKRPIHVECVKLLLRGTIEGRTRLELIEYTGMNIVSVGRYIHTLSTGTDKFIYISAWIKRYELKGPWVPVYSFGLNQPDVPKPPPRNPSRAKKFRKPTWIRVASNLRGIYHEYVGSNHPDAGKDFTSGRPPVATTEPACND